MKSSEIVIDYLRDFIQFVGKFNQRSLSNFQLTVQAAHISEMGVNSHFQFGGKKSHANGR